MRKRRVMTDQPNGGTSENEPLRPPPPPAPPAPSDQPATGSSSTWYENVGIIVVALLCCWPLGLVLVWLNKKWDNKTKWLITGLLIGFAVIVGIIGAISGGTSSNSIDSSKASSSASVTTARVTTTSTAAPTTTAAPATTQPPVTKPPSAPAPSVAPAPQAPAETVSQKNARKTAADYLRSSSFSRSGLIEQLKYEGFSDADATYGTDANNVDWNDQAAKTAAAYLRSSSFSRSGLIEQLKYEGFSQAQAEYGVSTTGL